MEERYTNVSEQVDSNLAALRKLHEEEVNRIKAEVRAELLSEILQREAEIENRSAALEQREKELEASFSASSKTVIPNCVERARCEFERAKTEKSILADFALASFLIIYSVEDLITELGLTGADKIAYRKSNAGIAWQTLLAWCVVAVNDVPEKSQIHKACNYVIRHYDELTAYLDDDFEMQR